MTVAQMHTAIGRILDDPGERRWDETLKNQALNAAQYRILKFLPADLLPELQASKASLSVPATGYALSGLDTTPGPILPGRYVNCYVSSLSLWAGAIWLDDLEFRAQNTFLKGSDTVPLAYIFGGSLFLQVTTYPATATLYYIRRPKEMVISGAVGYQATTCEFAPSRHDIVVEAACAQILRWEGELNEVQHFEQHVGAELVAEIQTFQSEKMRKIWV